MERKSTDEVQKAPIPAENADKGPFRYPPTTDEPAEADDVSGSAARKKRDGGDLEVEDDERFQATDN